MITSNHDESQNTNMATSHRTQAMHNTGSRPGRNVDWPAVVTSSGSRPAFVSEIYGKNVLTLSAFAALLPKPMFKNFLGHIKGSEVGPLLINIIQPSYYYYSIAH